MRRVMARTGQAKGCPLVTWDNFSPFIPFFWSVKVSEMNVAARSWVTEEDEHRRCGHGRFCIPYLPGEMDALPRPRHLHIHLDGEENRRPSRCNRWWPDHERSFQQQQAQRLLEVLSLALAQLETEGYLLSSRQRTFDEGKNLVFQFRLVWVWDPWTPSWEISGRQGKWRPPPSKLGLPLGKILPSLQRNPKA